MLIGGIGEFLSEGVGTIARKQRGYGCLRFCVGALDVFKVVVAIAVSPIVAKRGVRSEAVLIDVERDVLRELSVSGNSCIARSTHQILRGLIGDDIDHTSNGIASVERRGCSIEYLDTFYSCHIDAIQVDIIRDVAIEFLSVDKDEDVLISQAIQTQEGAHRTGSHRHLGHHPGEGAIEGADALFADFLSRKHMNGGSRTLESLVMARTCYHHRIQIIGTIHHR